MRLLKIVAVPAAVALLLTPTDAADARVRSKILGKINKSTLGSAQKGQTLAQTQSKAVSGDQCVDCDTPCHAKFGETHGECPDGEQYHPEKFTDRKDLYKFSKKNGRNPTSSYYTGLIIPETSDYTGDFGNPDNGFTGDFGNQDNGFIGEGGNQDNGYNGAEGNLNGGSRFTFQDDFDVNFNQNINDHTD